MGLQGREVRQREIVCSHPEAKVPSGGREVVLGMMNCVRDTGVDVTGLGLCWERGESEMTAAKFWGWV